MLRCQKTFEEYKIFSFGFSKFLDLTKAFVNFRPLEYATLVSLGRVGPKEPAVEGVGRSKKPPVKSLKRILYTIMFRFCLVNHMNITIEQHWGP